MSIDRAEGLAARSETDPERLRRRLRRRTAEIERREVERALSALDARGDLTEKQRETVRELGSVLVEKLTAMPERELEQAARPERTGTQEREREQKRERERARSICRLFDLDEP